MEVGKHVPPSSASGTGRPLSPHSHTPSSPAKSTTKKYEEAHRRASVTTAAIMDAAASNLAIIQDESDAFEGMSEVTAKKVRWADENPRPIYMSFTWIIFCDLNQPSPDSISTPSILNPQP